MSRINANNNDLRALLNTINNLPEATEGGIEEVTQFNQMDFANAEKGKIYSYTIGEHNNTLVYNEGRWDVYNEDGILKGSVDLTQDNIQLDGTKLKQTLFYDVIDNSYMTTVEFNFYSNMATGTFTLYDSIEIMGNGNMLFHNGSNAVSVYNQGAWSGDSYKYFSLKSSAMPMINTTITINMPTEFYLWLVCNSSMIIKCEGFAHLYSNIINMSGGASDNGTVLYYQFDNRLRRLVCDGTCWNVYDEGDLLLGTVPVGKNNTVLDGNILASYIFDEVPDLSYNGTITIPMVGVGGPAVMLSQGITIGSAGIYVGTSTTGTPIYSATTGWDAQWSSRLIHLCTNLTMTTPSYSNISATALLWLLVNGRFNRKSTLPTMHPVSVYTGTFTVSDTSDVTVDITTSPKFVPTSFVATIVGTGSTNSVCSIVAINTTTATYTRTTSGTATSQAGTNTVTYGVNQIVIPNRTSDNASRNLKNGTWRIVAW